MHRFLRYTGTKALYPIRPHIVSILATQTHQWSATRPVIPTRRKPRNSWLCHRCPNVMWMMFSVVLCRGYSQTPTRQVYRIHSEWTPVPMRVSIDCLLYKNCKGIGRELRNVSFAWPPVWNVIDICKWKTYTHRQIWYLFESDNEKMWDIIHYIILIYTIQDSVLGKNNIHHTMHYTAISKRVMARIVISRIPCRQIGIYM